MHPEARDLLAADADETRTSGRETGAILSALPGLSASAGEPAPTRPSKGTLNLLWSAEVLKSLQLKTAAFFLFAREIVANPGSVGAICPSSSKLSEKLAGQVPLEAGGLVLELGGGTGQVTAALLERGLSPTRIAVVERSPRLAQHLRETFPHLRIIEGDAAQLSRYVAPEERVAAVVSSLPMLSLPPETVHAIGGELDRVLDPGSLFIQFTYDPRTPERPFYDRLQPVRTFMVWGNLPPARVDVFAYR
jgi:phospholipid N-methyltransferase